MSQQFLIWAIFAPLIGAAASALVWLLPLRLKTRRDRVALEVIALLLGVGGLAAEALMLILAGGSITLQGTSLTLTASTTAAAAGTAACAALIFALLFPDSAAPSRHTHIADLAASGATGTLVGGALLSTDGAVQAVILLCASLVAGGYLVSGLPRITLEQRHSITPGSEAALLLIAGVKQTGLGVIAALLMVAGALQAARYPLHLENTSVLSTGLSLLSVGLAVRVGILPFWGGPVDMLKAAPRAAILALGALLPAALAVGALQFAALASRLAEVPPAGRQVALVLGSLGALLAGFRALAAVSPRESGEALPLLTASGVGLQAAWALFGVLSGTQGGIHGAVLLAANIAVTLPLLLAAQHALAPGPLRTAALWTGAASLLGLPPFGGFAGTLLVGGAAASISGVWVALLLIGSLLCAVGWGRALPQITTIDDEPGGNPHRGALFAWVLLAAQALFVALASTVVGTL